MPAGPLAVCLGELLIDFVPDERGTSLAQTRSFTKQPGGAPANVAVGLARLGVRSAFLGKVGEDPFGSFLVDVLEDNGVDVSQVRTDAYARTALAFVALTSAGDRDFVFYRHPSADMRYRAEEVDPEFLAAARSLHIGSISLIQEPSRSATLRALDLAAASGALISYDPNLRLALWPSAQAAKEGIRSVWRRANVIKMSEEELEFLTGSRDLSAARALRHDGLRLLAITRGDGGASYLSPSFEGDVAGFKVDTVDTTGAGDAFMAALLAGLLTDEGVDEDRSRLERLMRRANAYGALTTTRTGAIAGMPTAQELAHFLVRSEP